MKKVMSVLIILTMLLGISGGVSTVSAEGPGVYKLDNEVFVSMNGFETGDPNPSFNSAADWWSGGITTVVKNNGASSLAVDSNPGSYRGCNPILTSNGVAADLSQADYIQFWVNNTELNAAANLFAFVLFANVAGNYYAATLDFSVPGISLIDMSGNVTPVTNGTLSISAGFVGFVRIPLKNSFRMQTNSNLLMGLPYMANIEQIGIYISNSADTAANTKIYFDDFGYIKTFSPAEIFNDNMVLQQNSDVKIWGTGGIDGSTITMNVADITSSAVVQNGKWEISFPSPAGGYTSYDMTLSDGTLTKTIKNIVFGEVWVFAGQSNMNFTLNGSTGGAEEIAAASNSNIRILRTPLAAGFEYMNPENKYTGKWTQFDNTITTNTEELQLLPALAYFYLKNLQSKLNVPVGAIVSTCGDTTINEWISRSVVEQDTEIADTLNFNDNSALHSTHGAFYENLKSYAIPYASKGVVFYQGESNSYPDYGAIYNKYDLLLKKLVTSWRVDFNDLNKPFLIVQLPQYPTDWGFPETGWNYIKQAQSNAVSSLSETYLVKSDDLALGGNTTVHPINKNLLGLRTFTEGYLNVYSQTLSYGSFTGSVVSGEKILTNIATGTTAQSIADISYHRLTGFETGEPSFSTDAENWSGGLSTVKQGSGTYSLARDMDLPLGQYWRGINVNFSNDGNGEDISGDDYIQFWVDTTEFGTDRWLQMQFISLLGKDTYGNPYAYSLNCNSGITFFYADGTPIQSWNYVSNGEVGFFIKEFSGYVRIPLKNAFRKGDGSYATSSDLKAVTGLKSQTLLMAYDAPAGSYHVYFDDFTAVKNMGFSFKTTAGEPITDLSTVIGTGIKISITEYGVTTEYTAVIYGDLDGNGLISSADVTAIKQHMLGLSTLETIPLIAGDLYDEGSITLNDLVGIMADAS